jgi:hypothetical protein
MHYPIPIFSGFYSVDYGIGLFAGCKEPRLFPDADSSEDAECSRGAFSRLLQKDSQNCRGFEL